jgi:hypothetical protein
MIDGKVLLRATFVGIVLQIAMYVLGHYVPWVRLNAFMFAGMMISATAGYLYSMDASLGWFAGATGGAIAGGVCGFIGVGLSVLLGDTPSTMLATLTAIAVLVGAVGGPFGQMAANMRAMGGRR